MRKLLLMFLVFVFIIPLVNALCWNPLELFCIFDEEENTYLDTRDNSTTTISSGGSISVNQFQTPKVFYEIGKNYPIEIIDKNCFKFLTPNITDIIKDVTLDELEKISLNQMKYEDKDGKVSYLNYKENNTICHNLTVGFSIRWGFGSTLIFVNNTDVGVYIGSYFNTTGGFVQRNKSFSEGYYLPPINFTFFNGSAVTVNTTWNENQTVTFTPTNSVNGTLRLNFTLDGDISVSESTKNISQFPGKRLLFALEFEDSSDSFMRDIVSGAEPLFNWPIVQQNITNDGWDDRGLSTNKDDGTGDGVAFGNLPAFYFNDTTQPTGYNNSNGTLLMRMFPRYPGSDPIVILKGGGIANMNFRDSGLVQMNFRTDGDCSLDNHFGAGPTEFEWSCVAFRKNATEYAMIVNGVQQYAQTCTGQIIPLSTGTCGSAGDSDCMYFGSNSVATTYNGTLDSIRFYAEYLSDEQIIDYCNEKNWTPFSTKQTDTGVSEDLFNWSVGVQDVSEVVADTTPPAYSNFKKNITDANIISTSAIEFNITIDDTDNSVLYWNFSHNISGTWVNITNSTDLTNPSQTNVSLSGSVGDKIAYMFCASDDQGNVGCDNVRTFTIQAEDTCSPTTPLTSNHVFDANDNCVISSSFDAGGFNVECTNIAGAGTLTVKAEVFNYNLWITNKDCIDVCEAGVVSC